MKKNIAFFLFCISINVALVAQFSVDSLTQELTQLCNTTKVPGFAVAIVNTEGVVYQNAFGYSDIQLQSPYQTTTIQNIGSTSKTFIGVAIMKAVEQGKLSLDTPINDILPFKVIHPKYPNTPITVKHLATHTSGIHDTNRFFTTDYIAEAVTRKNLKGAGVINRIHFKKMSKNKKILLGEYLKEYLSEDGVYYKKKNFKAKPGTTYNYTNAGAGLGAYVLEVATGQSFEEYTQEHIFDPLNMTETGWHFGDVDMNKHATLYTPKKVTVVPRYSLNTYPDGGLLTNIEDLSRYAIEILKSRSTDGNIVTQESATIMSANYITEVSNADENQGYGIFWDVAKSGAFGHSGSDPGANSFLYLFPEENIGILFIVNMSLDDNKKTIPIFQELWRVLRQYSKTISKEKK